jgi:hypothetical protein
MYSSWRRNIMTDIKDKLSANTLNKEI